MATSGVLRQLMYTAHGPPLSALAMRSGTIPTPGASEVLVKFLASPINPSDINQVEGVYPKSPSLPAVGGNEGLAEVVQVGRDCATDLKEGDRVIPRWSCLGTWTSHLASDAGNFIKLPGDVDPLQAATLSVNPCTAYRMLHDFCQLQPGDYVVQNGATSAVGQAAIQLAKVFGWKTINIVRKRPEDQAKGDAEMRAHLQELGADHIVYDDELMEPDTRALFKETRPRLALNCVGGKPLSTLCKVMPQHGTVVTYGGMSKKPIMLPTAALIFQDLHFHGFWMTRWNDTTDLAERQRMLDTLLDLIRSGQLATRVQTHALENWEEAITQATAPYKLDKHVLVF
ncbi:hypothetical protein PTSG_01560 [Salpingoeca rosetta]|uniref:enoyl-[acyl-carrier-protein] reductase n=1 Tax=Salpingoeca rosetta (strain ATCC 50818 / BSB-021) TaxID=946362 RepID=F2U0Q0_SALR5|nr:uncharacterized protein PTSG_01560 [Salpingoeca rosetta]EGD80978.1 hypothetical protein PTSG_01560 [Salpingoeca rosetta]|eukprot:XP_004997539.1 hypothetical protein PTSG_01560 [Salpingoeca rosetta]